MRYVRYLKLPKLEAGKVSALITVASDLGETFLDETVELEVFVDSESSSGKPQPPVRKTFKWNAGFRVLSIVVPLSHGTPKKKLWMTVGGGFSGDSLQPLTTSSGIVACSASITRPGETIEHQIMRRFLLQNGTTFGIIEDGDQSIARHIWYVSLSNASWMDIQC
jgi:hypothetical protein